MTELRESAVLVPLYRDAGGELQLVLVRRVRRGVHGGQLAFPGGMVESQDRSRLDTALREAEEEIGLVAAAVEVLGELPIVDTVTTGYRISPFLARIERPDRWRRQASEIDEILEVPVADFGPDTHAETLEDFPAWSEPRRFPCYRVGPHALWGASYRILHPLLPRLAAGDWDV